MGLLSLNILSVKYMADANTIPPQNGRSGGYGIVLKIMPPNNGYFWKKASLLDQRILIGLSKAIVLKRGRDNRNGIVGCATSHNSTV
jgi:hypothetical protein